MTKLLNFRMILLGCCERLDLADLNIKQLEYLAGYGWFKW